MKKSRFLIVCGAALLVAASLYACRSSTEGAENTSAPDPKLNSDGDCMTDLEELAAGTDPKRVDGDGDGVSDCDELACGSDPADAQEKCYACGWKRNAPDNLVSDGAGIGNVVENIKLPDQCGEQVSLWDFHGQYFIMYMTAAW